MRGQGEWKGGHGVGAEKVGSRKAGEEEDASSIRPTTFSAPDEYEMRQLAKSIREDGQSLVMPCHRIH